MVNLTNQTATTPSITNGAVSSASQTNVDGVGLTAYGYSGAGTVGRSFLNLHRCYDLTLATSLVVTSVRLRINVVTASGEAIWGFYHLDNDDEMRLHWYDTIDFSAYSTGAQYMTFTPGDLVLKEGRNIFFIIGNVANTIFENFTTGENSSKYAIMPSLTVTDYYDQTPVANPDYFLQSQYPKAVYVLGYPSIETNSDAGDFADVFTNGELNRTEGGSYTNGSGNSYLFGRPFTLSHAFEPVRISATMQALSPTAITRVRAAIYSQSGVLIIPSIEPPAETFYDVIVGDSTPDCEFVAGTVLNAGSYYMVFQVEYDSTNSANLSIKTDDSSALDNYLQRPVSYGDLMPSTVSFNTQSRMPYMLLTYKKAALSSETFGTTWKDRTETWAANTETWADVVDYTNLTNTA